MADTEDGCALLVPQSLKVLHLLIGNSNVTKTAVGGYHVLHIDTPGTTCKYLFCLDYSLRRVKLDSKANICTP